MPAPHVDIVKSDTGFFALVHPMGSVGPRVIEAPDLEALYQRITSMLIGEHAVPQEDAMAHTDVRNVESTIMAAWVKGKKDANSSASSSG